jgi:hypothetical protein
MRQDGKGIKKTRNKDKQGGRVVGYEKDFLLL